MPSNITIRIPVTDLEKVVEYDAGIDEYTDEFDTIPHEEEKPDLGYIDYSDMDDGMGGFVDD